MPIFKKLNLAVILPLLVFLGFLILVKNTKAAAANHVVISEIQVGGNVASDEFVELYNPTNSDVNLSGWRLRLGASSNLVASMSGTIKSHGHFLVANPFYLSIPVSPDMVYSATSSAVTANSFITLQSKSGSTYTNEDLVGMGTAATFEGTAVPAPAAGKSIERTPLGEDTDNNLNDFVLKDIPNPQNSSFIETTPTPTATPSESPTLTPTPTPTETPTPTPTATASPTLEPTISPSPTPTPVPTETPTNSPTPTLLPTESPTPTVSATPTATETPSPTPTLSPTTIPTFSPTPTPTNVPFGWLKSPVFTCSNPHVPNFVYALLKFLMPYKFHCS